MSGLRLWALLHYHGSGPRSSSAHFHGDCFCRTLPFLSHWGCIPRKSSLSFPARRSGSGAGTVFSLSPVLLRGKDAIPKSPIPLPCPSFGRKFSWISPHRSLIPWTPLSWRHSRRTARILISKLHGYGWINWVILSVILQAPVESGSLSWIHGDPHTTHTQHPHISASLCSWEFREKMDFSPVLQSLVCLQSC